VRDTLAAHGLGVVLKTHDGDSWMSRYDHSDNAISGPRAVEEFAGFFEQAGVPFHAWAVVKGQNPAREAEMAADVLAAGARSIFLDLEAHAGFWVGSDQDAQRYGETLRRLQPSGWVSTSIDPRPWELDRVPLAEFAAFSDEIAPQVYWSTFASVANVVKYALERDIIGPDGVTPGFVLHAAMSRLRAFDLPIHPIGDGTVTAAWGDFIEESYRYGAEAVSLWRYGVATPEHWQLLQDTPPRSSIYVVQPGDTLSGIAARHGATIGGLASENGITNANQIVVGARLRIPGRGPAGGAAPSASPPGTGGGQPRTHVVAAGETLSGIAEQYGVTTGALATANAIANQHLIQIGQRLTIP